MKDWKEWFKVRQTYPNSCICDDTEELRYQAFLARMINEGYIKKPRKKAVKVKVSESDLESFDLFYSYYPRKTGRQEALKKWMILNPSPDLKKTMYDHYTVAYKDTEKAFIPHFSTYLNQARWNDEIIKVKPKLLAVPHDDEKLWPFANEHGLKQPGVMNYFEYRNILRKEVQEKQLMA